MKRWLATSAFAFALASALAASAPALATTEPDHAIHEELRAMLRGFEQAMSSGRYDDMLPLLHERVWATSLTQEVMGSREDVSKYFRTWFGPDGYMKGMTMKLEADALTELSPDKRFGLVRGSANEVYDAKEGYRFDFRTRWTAVLAKGDDERWRLRAIHFGTNNLDNPVLTRVRDTLTRYLWIGTGLGLAGGLGVGFWLGRRRPRLAAA